MGADRLTDVRPHGQQDALALVVTGTVGVRLAKSPAAIGPSTADTIWAREISSGGRARTYPPPTPRLDGRGRRPSGPGGSVRGRAGAARSARRCHGPTWDLSEAWSASDRSARLP